MEHLLAHGRTRTGFVADLHVEDDRAYLEVMGQHGLATDDLHFLLTVDPLKIDGAFTRDLVRDDQTGELVRVIIEMSRVLGLEVVAERVETPGQASVLRSLGCGSVQGWLYSRAVPGTDAGALLGSPLSAKVASEAPCLG
jgi:EAL domain-containing protein (putative c-di-GMP-specific phosphodiesterase class I)